MLFVTEQYAFQDNLQSTDLKPCSELTINVAPSYMS